VVLALTAETAAIALAGFDETLLHILTFF